MQQYITELIMPTDVKGHSHIFRNIETHFANLIIRKELVPGDRLPSINQVAASMNIDKRTVLQAYQCLAGRGLVEVRSGKGTFVTEKNAGNMRTTNIALVSYVDANVSNGHGHYGHAVYAGIRECVLEYDLVCHWIKINTDMLSECKSKNVSGCIFMGSDETSHLLLEDFERAKLKAITIGGRDDQNIPFVHGDDIQGIYLIMDHLFNLGHQRIALFYGYAANYSAQRRLAAYQYKMEQAELDINPSWICASSTSKEDASLFNQRLKKWFSSNRPPTAIIAAGEFSSLATLQLLNMNGIKVPEDVSVCGYDDFPGIQEFATPALTVIRQPVVEIGRTAVRNLVALLDGEKVENRVLPVELIVRASTAKAKDR